MNASSQTGIGAGNVVRRVAILERLRRVQPDIIALVAPAGFGKSTLARQFAEGRDNVAICECAHLTGDLDLARRIVPALAEESPQRGAGLSQRELMLGDGAMSAAERVALALSAWRAAAPRSTFILDDAEHVMTAESTRHFFTRLLAERPEARTLVICSREILRIHLTRFASPHRIVTLRADDLAFTRYELDEVFAGQALEANTIDRVYEITQGWPVPVLFLARLAIEGRHEALLQRLGDVAFGELYEYLADQVLDTLAPQLISALFAAACVPDAARDDLILATSDSQSADVLEEFERFSPFVTRTPQDRYVVHPLMRAMLTEGAIRRCEELLAATAVHYDERGDHLRAAELHLARHDQEAAARSLECVRVGEDRAPSMRYSRLVSTLDRSVVRRYPTLWACSALLQTFSADSRQLLEETGSLWATLAPDTPLNKRYYVLATRTLLLTYLGAFQQALDLLDSAAPRSAIPRPPTEREHGYALFLRGAVITRLGRLAEAEVDLEQAWPLVESMDVMASAILMIRGAEIERVRANRVAERELLARSIEYARRSQLVNFLAYRLAEATFSAWLAGDEREFAQHADELERIVRGDGIRGFRFFSDCAQAHDDAVPREIDLIRSVVYAHLIAAGMQTDRAAMYRHADAAREAARSYQHPFLQALASLAVAELSSPPQRASLYAEARAYASRIDEPVFAEAVARAEREPDGAGPLQVFLSRLRRNGPSEFPRLEISLLLGTVRVRGNGVKLAERELELLFALARRRETVTREAATDMLWPDRDEEAAVNLLKVHLHRLRAHLGDETAVVRTRDGLRLCDEACVDLWEIERSAATWRHREIATDLERDAVAALYTRLCVERPTRLLAWEWFAPIERSIRELRLEFAQQLARYALRKNRVEDALRLAADMTDYDPCDEAAREVAIAAHLAVGNRAAALREYRQYRDVLVSELQCEPSPSLSALLNR